MGGLIAYEAVRLLQDRDFPPPTRLIISGCPAPQHGFGGGERPDPSVADIVDLLWRVGGLPREIAADEDAAAYYGGLAREDGRLLADYRYAASPRPLTVGVTVLHGERDPVTARLDPRKWEAAVGRPVTVRTVPGDGHHFIATEAGHCTRIVRQDLADRRVDDVDARRLYLDLLKKTLTNVIYEDPPVPSDWAPDAEYDRIARATGLDWPSRAHTMIGLRRLDNLQECVERVLDDAILGDFIETGVWRGGSCIFMRALLKAYGVPDRRVWAADSFRGMPLVAPDGHRGDAELGTHLFNDVMGVALETVKANFQAYGLLDDQVRFLPGWFRETLPAAPIQQLAILRLDGDLYESTMDALTHLYPKLSVGGFVIVDDYLLKVCREAVHDFRQRHGIEDEIKDIDGYGAYWRRTR